MKTGLDYFPLDVYGDDRWDLIEAEFGITGFGVMVKLYQKIYGGAGYYCDWTREVALLFCHGCGLGGGVVSEIVAAAFRRGFFDKALYERYRILTSAEIQKRYFEAATRRKQVTVIKEYLLVELDQKIDAVVLSKEDRNAFSGNGSISGKNVDILKVSVDTFEQRKEKKRKAEKRKLEKRKAEPPSGERKGEGAAVRPREQVGEQNPSEASPFSAVPDGLKEAFRAYFEMRRQLQKPLTPYGVSLALKELDKLAPGDMESQKKILNQSVFHSWQGLFPLEERKTSLGKRGERQQTKKEKAKIDRAALSELEESVLFGK